MSVFPASRVWGWLGTSTHLAPLLWASRQLGELRLQRQETNELTHTSFLDMDSGAAHMHLPHSIGQRMLLGQPKVGADKDAPHPVSGRASSQDRGRGSDKDGSW